MATLHLTQGGRIVLLGLYKYFQNRVEPVKYGFHQDGPKQCRNAEQFDDAQEKHLIPLLRDNSIDTHPKTNRISGLRI